MVLASLSKVFIGKESTWGLTGTPSLLIPSDPPTFTVPAEQILDQAFRGIAARDFGAYQGVLAAEASIGGPFFPEECGFLLNGIMGTASVAAGGTPWDHTFSLAAVAPSLVLQDEQGIETGRFRGMQVAEFTLAFNAAEGFLTYTASLSGKDRTEAADCGLADQTTIPLRGWQMSVSVGGTALGKLLEGELTLSREVALRYVDGNNQVPQAADLGPLEVTGRATLRYDSIVDYDRFLTKQQPTFQISFDQGSGAAQKQLVFLASKMDFGDGAAEIDRSAVSLTLAYTMRALYNATDAGPCKFTLKNAKPDYNP